MPKDNTKRNRIKNREARKLQETNSSKWEHTNKNMDKRS
jgi:hypothetical protein